MRAGEISQQEILRTEVAFQRALKIADPTPLRVLPDEFADAQEEARNRGAQMNESDFKKEKSMSVVSKHKAWPLVTFCGGLAIIAATIILSGAVERAAGFAGIVIAGIGYVWRTLEK